MKVTMTANIKRRVVMLMCLLWASNTSASTLSNSDQKRLSGLTIIEWRAIAKASKLPLEVIYALALRESGHYDKSLKIFTPTPNALAIGKEPKVGQKKHIGLFTLDDKRKIELLDNLVAKGHTNLGIGMFQISYRYNRWRAEKPSDLYDPKVNAKAAVGVINECQKRHKSTIDVLSCYRRGKVTRDGLLYGEEVLRLANKYGRKFAQKFTGQSQRVNVPTRKVVSEDAKLTPLELLKKYYRDAESEGSDPTTSTITIVN